MRIECMEVQFVFESFLLQVLFILFYVFKWIYRIKYKYIDVVNWKKTQNKKKKKKKNFCSHNKTKEIQIDTFSAFIVKYKTFFKSRIGIDNVSITLVLIIYVAREQALSEVKPFVSLNKKVCKIKFSQILKINMKKY